MQQILFSKAIVPADCTVPALPDAVSIEQARQEAHELRGLTKGIDPREAEREQAAVKLAEQERVAAELEAQRAGRRPRPCWWARLGAFI